MDVALADLEARHDAVFFGAGLGADSALAADGAELPGVEGAVHFIERMKLSATDLAGIEMATVVGGGNTAVDAVRELIGLGIGSVTMVYRGDEAAMSGYAHEWSEAKREGARAVWRAQPLAYLGDGAVTGLRCALLDASKKPIAGEEIELPTDLVLLAIGQGKLGDLLAGLPGIEVARGVIVTDANGRTGRGGWYAGGDAANGGKEVVNAAAEGKRAALAIHADLEARS